MKKSLPALKAGRLFGNQKPTGQAESILFVVC